MRDLPMKKKPAKMMKVPIWVSYAIGLLALTC